MLNSRTTCCARATSSRSVGARRSVFSVVTTATSPSPWPSCPGADAPSSARSDASVLAARTMARWSAFLPAPPPNSPAWTCSCRPSSSARLTPRASRTVRATRSAAWRTRSASPCRSPTSRSSALYASVRLATWSSTAASTPRRRRPSVAAQRGREERGRRAGSEGVDVGVDLLDVEEDL